MKNNSLNLILLMCFLFGTMHFTAQVEFDNSVPHSRFTKVRTTDNFIYVTAGIKKDYKNTELTLMDHNGKEVSRFLISAKNSPSITYAGTAANGNTFFALNNDTYVVVNAKGEKIDEKSFTGEDNIKHEKMLFAEDGLVLIQKIKVKKVGIGLIVRKFDFEYNELWKWEKFPEKGRIDFEDCILRKDGSLAFTFTKSATSNDLGLCLISASGEENAFDYFTTVQEKMDYYNFRESRNGNLLLFADYGSDNTAQSGPAALAKGKPIGLGIVTLDGTTGKIANESLINFVDVQAQVGDKRADGTPVYTENVPLLHFMDIVFMDGKSYYLCESTLMDSREVDNPRSSTTPPARMTISPLTLGDYYLFDTTDLMAAPIRVWKSKRTIELASSDVPVLRKVMMANRMFSYQGMMDGKIVTRGMAHMHHYYTLIDPKAGVEKLTDRVFLDAYYRGKANVLPATANYSFEDIGSFGKVDIGYEGILPVSQGFLVYDYDGKGNKLNFATIKN